MWLDRGIVRVAFSICLKSKIITEVYIQRVLVEGNGIHRKSKADRKSRGRLQVRHHKNNREIKQKGMLPFFPTVAMLYDKIKCY